MRCLKPGCTVTWPRDPVLEVPCPSCGVGIGAVCLRPSGHRKWGAKFYCDARDIAADKAGKYGVCPTSRCGFYRGPGKGYAVRINAEART